MNILVTGSAGFIGSALSLKLLERGEKVIGVDNHNDYYDPKLKEDRLVRYENNSNYKHYRIDISDYKKIEEIFSEHKPQIVINLAAQAGVRHSIKDPMAYVKSNMLGFFNVLENCRNHNIEHLIYASSSSVYGANTKMPFSEHDSTDHPLSLYAASKKSNELMAHAYSNLYQLPTTGLRFFTVYGPWGRPDMALFKFTDAILKDKVIDIFNHGKHKRDFTYIDDIIEGVVRIVDCPATSNPDWNSAKPDLASSNVKWRIYNIGNNKSVNLLDYINALEKALGKKAKINMLPIQPGDILDTHANIDRLKEKFQYNPTTSIDIGIVKFVEWFKHYYNY